MGTPVMESHPGFIEEIDYDEMDIRDPVGKGSFGVVYMAIWHDIHVAVKMIESESERIAFMTELRQLSRVCHPNIIRLYGACRNPVSLVMEFAECGSLYNLLHGPGRQPHYTSGHAMSWCLQCATGVAYLHGMKPKALIHRDLKPPNLLLTNQGTVLKICDFGTACDQHTHMTNNKGSAAWMAPEVFEGCQYSEKCDVFSWGIIIWEVLTRRKPFDELGGPAFRIMWAVHTGARPNLIQGCPRPVEQLMSRCWSSKPNERPSMDEVVDAMTDLMKLFPGGQTPLVFPHHDGTSSGTNSSYEYSLSDSMRETHISTISDTVRKNRSVHPGVASLMRSRVGSSPSLSQAQDVIESRVRSRSHTPDPQKATPETSIIGDAGKKRNRRSSADLIAEIEHLPLEPQRGTPLGSRSASPCQGRPAPRKASPPSLAPVSVLVPQTPTPTNPAPIPTPTPGVPGVFVDAGQPTDNNSQCDSLPRAYITLELHLQPLPPTTSSKKSMDIYQRHCLLAEQYSRVQTEIILLKQRRQQLHNELERDEMENEEGNRLAIEYQRLVAENTSLKKWFDKMKKDLAHVRENQTRVY
uniref:Mitogen-activated protein kinase kinase kinase 7 n=1 Tax=Phallusia mammillata TaxID=59560 RepID=A0A6F9DKR6_9ASCI|nr:Tak1/MAPKKK7 mitogen-activated protein kinase kinase kinase 7 [Phallusia mammillata]